MKAMILAAGLGKRMRPLTDKLPKPLIEAGNKMLIEYHLEALAKAGFKDIVINTHWCADKVPAALGSGEKWGLQIHYSHEPELLETAGGIHQALPLLCNSEDELFLVINGDIYCEFDLSQWLTTHSQFVGEQNACLAMTANPEQHPDGDFSLSRSGGQLSLTQPGAPNRYTYAGLALFRARFFNDLAPGARALAPPLKKAIQAGKVFGVLMHDKWMDIGTPERLSLLDNYLSTRNKSL